MTCSCQKETEKLLTDHYSKKLPQARELSVHLMGYGIVMDQQRGCKSLPFMTAEVRQTVTVKKTGADKRKVDKTSFFFTYCPFCGTPLQPTAKDAL